MPNISRQAAEPYPLNTQFESAVALYTAKSTEFFERIGQHLEPDALGLSAARLAVSAAQAIAAEVGHGPGSCVVVLQRLRQLMNQGRVSKEQIDEVGDLFDTAEDTGLPSEEVVVTELAPLMRRRHHNEAVRVAMAEYANKGDFARVQDLLATANSIGTAGPRTTARTRRWPVLGGAALQGLPGQFLSLVEPHTEGDPAALLVQLLVAVGSAFGRGPHFVVEADKHHLNLFTAIVGDTAKGRKGTSWGHVQSLIREADPTWQVVPGGLTTGEGIIHHVRDARKATKTKNGQLVEEVEDGGVTDKRLMVVESELVSTLRKTKLQGNTLSATLRTAWDRGDLRTLSKTSPETATNAHVSVIGHITKSELVRELGRNDVSNGFANRFLWVCAKRSKHLPDGGHVDRRALSSLSSAFAKALGFAVDDPNWDGSMSRDPSAADLWRAVYAELSAGRRGQLGAVTSRAEAQVTRLSCLYALLDKSRVVQKVHLDAALAVWKYVEDSCAYIFGESCGSSDGDRILDALRRAGSGGLKRTEIISLFSNKKKSAEISRLGQFLLEGEWIVVRHQATEGRNAEVWALANGEESEVGEEGEKRNKPGAA